jgi:hypothetical protein
MSPSGKIGSEVERLRTVQEKVILGLPVNRDALQAVSLHVRVTGVTLHR